MATAYEDDVHRLDDSTLLDRAGELGRLPFSMDRDLLGEATRRQRQGRPFPGVAYAHQRIGRCVDDLELLAKVSDLEELVGQVVHLLL